MATVLYGIKNCDTVKAARRWLDDADIDYQFHDFRQNGLSSSKLNSWMNLLGSKVLINRRSTSWKNLTDSQRAAIDRGEGSLTILENPTLIKRPVLEHGGQVQCGFAVDHYQSIFAEK